MRWIGVDLDGSLAEHTSSPDWKIGNPNPKVLRRVMDLLDQGKIVKIFTARACDPAQIPVVKQWLKDNGLPDLEVTNAKDYGTDQIWDDRARQIVDGDLAQDAPVKYNTVSPMQIEIAIKMGRGESVDAEEEQSTIPVIIGDAGMMSAMSDASGMTDQQKRKQRKADQNYKNLERAKEFPSLPKDDDPEFVKYVAHKDEKTRPEHKALDGRIMRADSVAAKSVTPPADANCRCKVVPVDKTAKPVSNKVEKDYYHQMSDYIAFADVKQPTAEQLSFLKKNPNDYYNSVIVALYPDDKPKQGIAWDRYLEFRKGEIAKLKTKIQDLNKDNRKQEEQIKTLRSGKKISPEGEKLIKGLEDKLASSVKLYDEAIRVQARYDTEYNTAKNMKTAKKPEVDKNIKEIQDSLKKLLAGSYAISSSKEDPDVAKILSEVDTIKNRVGSPDFGKNLEDVNKASQEIAVLLGKVNLAAEVELAKQRRVALDKIKDDKTAADEKLILEQYKNGDIGYKIETLLNPKYGGKIQKITNDSVSGILSKEDGLKPYQTKIISDALTAKKVSPAQLGVEISRYKDFNKKIDAALSGNGVGVPDSVYKSIIDKANSDPSKAESIVNRGVAELKKTYGKLRADADKIAEKAKKDYGYEIPADKLEGIKSSYIKNGISAFASNRSESDSLNAKLFEIDAKTKEIKTLPSGKMNAASKRSALDALKEERKIVEAQIAKVDKPYSAPSSIASKIANDAKRSAAIGELMADPSIKLGLAEAKEAQSLGFKTAKEYDDYKGNTGKYVKSATPGQKEERLSQGNELKNAAVVSVMKLFGEVKSKMPDVAPSGNKWLDDAAFRANIESSLDNIITKAGGDMGKVKERVNEFVKLQEGNLSKYINGSLVDEAAQNKTTEAGSVDDQMANLKSSASSTLLKLFQDIKASNPRGAPSGNDWIDDKSFKDKTEASLDAIIGKANGDMTKAIEGVNQFVTIQKVNLLKYAPNPVSKSEPPKSKILSPAERDAIYAEELDKEKERLKAKIRESDIGENTAKAFESVDSFDRIEDLKEWENTFDRAVTDHANKIKDQEQYESDRDYKDLAHAKNIAIKLISEALINRFISQNGAGVTPLSSWSPPNKFKSFLKDRIKDINEMTNAKDVSDYGKTTSNYIFSRKKSSKLNLPLIPDYDDANISLVKDESVKQDKVVEEPKEQGFQPKATASSETSDNRSTETPINFGKAVDEDVEPPVNYGKAGDENATASEPDIIPPPLWEITDDDEEKQVNFNSLNGELKPMEDTQAFADNRKDNITDYKGSRHYQSHAKSSTYRNIADKNAAEANPAETLLRKKHSGNDAWIKRQDLIGDISRRSDISASVKSRLIGKINDGTIAAYNPDTAQRQVNELVGRWNKESTSSANASLDEDRQINEKNYQKLLAQKREEQKQRDEKIATKYAGMKAEDVHRSAIKEARETGVMPIHAQNAALIAQAEREAGYSSPTKMELDPKKAEASAMIQQAISELGASAPQSVGRLNGLLRNVQESATPDRIDSITQLAAKALAAGREEKAKAEAYAAQDKANSPSDPEIAANVQPEPQPQQAEVAQNETQPKDEEQALCDSGGCSNCGSNPQRKESASQIAVMFGRKPEEVYEKAFADAGKCSGSCVKKIGGGWRVISNKTGKPWPAKYESEAKAKDALAAYHAK